MNSKILADLRKSLANLYADESSIRRIVDQAELNSQRIVFTSTALNTWYSVLAEAEKVHRTETLLDIVADEYGNNQEFRAVRVAYRQATGRSGSRKVDPQSSSHQQKRPMPYWRWSLSIVLFGLLLIGVATSWRYGIFSGPSGRSGDIPTITATATDVKLADAALTPTATPMPSVTANVAIVPSIATATPDDRLATPSPVISPSPTQAPSMTSLLVPYQVRVADRENQAIANAEVLLTHSQGYEIAFTDSQGFAIFQLSSTADLGTSQLLIEAPGFEPYTQTVADPNKKAGVEEVRLASVTQATALVTNSPWCEFAFTILDKANEAPIAKAEVSVTLGSRPNTGYTDSTGYYASKLPCDNPSSASVRIRIFAEGYQTHSETVPLIGEIKEILLSQVTISPPLPTPILQPTATVTPTPPVTFTPIPTPQTTVTAIGVPVADYPCEAEIISPTGAQSVNTLRAKPLLSSSLRGALTVGSIVLVIQKAEDVLVWYRITQTDGSSLGWIPAENLILSPNCP